MNINERDLHLKKRIGIIPDTEIVNTSFVSTQINQTRTVTQMVTEDESDHDRELIEGRQRLKNINSQLEDVLSSHSEVAAEFNKSRDVEAVAQLAKTMIDLNKEIRDTNKDLHGERGNVKKTDNNTQNNIYISGDTRSILESVNENVINKE